MDICGFVHGDERLNSKAFMVRRAAEAGGAPGACAPFPDSIVNPTPEDLLAFYPSDARFVTKRAGLQRQLGVAVLSRDELSAHPFEAEELVQRFISDPLLLQPAGLKFTMRVYAFATRADRAFYLHSSGKVYHCVEPFAEGTRGATVTSGYLSEEAIAGLPYSLAQLREALGAEVYDAIWGRVVEKTRLLAQLMAPHVAPVDVYDGDRRAVLLGVDVEVDAALEPWVLEANVYPDMGFKNDVDVALKTAVLDDMRDLCMNGVRSAALTRLV